MTDRVRRPLVALGVAIAVVFLAYNTNPGKRLLAYTGLAECYEVTLTGNVVCGDQGERIGSFKDELKVDADLAREDILPEDTSFSDGEGHRIEIKTSGLFGVKPEKVCQVMVDEDYMPATVIDARSDVTLAEC